MEVGIYQRLKSWPEVFGFYLPLAVLVKLAEWLKGNGNVRLLVAQSVGLSLLFVFHQVVIEIFYPRSDIKFSIVDSQMVDDFDIPNFFSSPVL